MISQIDKNTVTTVLTNILGNYLVLKGELVFYCPFCHHHKHKLQVNLDTQKWHCWVCNNGGSRLKYLLDGLDADRRTKEIIKGIYKDWTHTKRADDAQVFITLPKEFKALSVKPTGFNPEYTQAIHYLLNRGIGLREIIKYNIGYCAEGRYARRLIIPSYWEDSSLNYFISRSYYEDEPMKYKNPPTTKNIVCLDSHINWNEDISIVEGFFDAVSIRRNAIPILGKFLSRELMGKILTKKPPTVNVCLDDDALKDSIKMIEYLLKNGIKVKFINPKPYKDFGEAGYMATSNLIKESKNFDFYQLMMLKIGTI